MPALRRHTAVTPSPRLAERMVLASSCAGWIEGHSRQERMERRQLGRRCAAWAQTMRDAPAELA